MENQFEEFDSEELRRFNESLEGRMEAPIYLDMAGQGLDGALEDGEESDMDDADELPHLTIDLDRIKVGVNVRHEYLGLGRIKEICPKDRTLVVTFDEDEITFGYPDAFEEGFLELQ